MPSLKVVLPGSLPEIVRKIVIIYEHPCATEEFIPFSSTDNYRLEFNRHRNRFIYYPPIDNNIWSFIVVLCCYFYHGAGHAASDKARCEYILSDSFIRQI